MTGPTCRMLGIACSALLLLTACADRQQAGPPVLSLAGRQCAPQPDLSAAQALALEGDGSSIKHPIDNTAACVEGADGGKSLYRVFQLPQSAKSYMVAISSEPLGHGLFSPRVILLDAAGAKLRELPRDMFLFHGASLYAALRIHPEERYLVVASDPQTTGQTVSQIVGSTRVSTVNTGAVMFNMYTGAEANNTYTYAHSGVVTVTAKLIPGEEGTK